MKKMIVSLCVFLFFFSVGFGQNSNEKRLPDFFKFWHESPEYIYGNVKELHISSFDAIQRDGEIVKAGNVISGSNWAENSSYYFNANGQLIQSNMKFSNGEWTGTFSYEDDRLISINWLNDNVYKYRWDYSYTEDGNLELTYFDVIANEVNRVLNYELDKNGFFIKRSNPMNRDRADVYERKNDGTIVDKKVISKDGETISHMDKWEYDDRNNKTKVHRAVWGGKKDDFYGASRTYEYDDNGNWIKQTAINPVNKNIRIVERNFVFFE